MKKIRKVRVGVRYNRYTQLSPCGVKHAGFVAVTPIGNAVLSCHARAETFESICFHVHPPFWGWFPFLVEGRKKVVSGSIALFHFCLRRSPIGAISHVGSVFIDTVLGMFNF